MTSLLLNLVENVRLPDRLFNRPHRQSFLYCRQMVFNRFVSKRSLLQLYKGEIMKLRLDIDQQYTEEQIIIEAPALSSKIQKVQDICTKS